MASRGETLREKASRLMNEYEALGARAGGESAYAEAMTIYQQLLGEHPDDARLHLEYGYLQECHGRNLIRAAAGCYERAIELDPGWDKPHYQLIFARSALHESERVIELYKQRLAAAPDQIREYRFLAGAYLRSGALDEAGKVIAAGRKLEPDDDMLLAAEAELLDASGRREEALAAWRTLKQRDPKRHRASRNLNISRGHSKGKSSRAGAGGAPTLISEQVAGLVARTGGARTQSARSAHAG